MTRCTIATLGILVAGCVLALPARGDDVRSAGPYKGFGRIHPRAPEETRQFSFLVGEWNCKTRFRNADGSGYNEGRAKWIGYFILDGWAIQDDWVGYGPEGQEFHGTNIRSFNPRTKEWDNRWLPAGSLQWKYYSAEKQGPTMVMIGGEGTDPRGDYIDRNVFHDIERNHWAWRKDRSWDGGETWVEGIGFIEATRVGSAGPATPAAESDARPEDG
jgi:hypothetical protein